MPDRIPNAAGVPEPARSAFERSGRLVLSGRYEEALAATEETARLLRESNAGARTSAGGPAATVLLAYALALRCEALSKLGRWEECLHTATEAVALGRSQPAAAPFTAPLAATLLVLGKAQMGLGRPQEALGATGESVRLYGRLAAKDAAHRPHFGTALDHFGVVLSRLGLNAQALRAAEKSVTLFRRLARKDPSAHTPGLAQAVNNLARRQSARNQDRRALRSIHEAVALYRHLAQVDPPVYRRDLAMALGNVCRMNPDRVQVLAAAQESVAILQELDTNDHNIHGGQLADSLGLLAGALADVGRYQEAADVSTRSVAATREQSAINPVARRGDLVRALTMYAMIRAETGTELPEALAAVAEASAVIAELAAENPQMYASGPAEVRAVGSRLLAMTQGPDAG